MSVTIDATSSSTGAAGTTLTWAHTVAAGSNRVLVVLLALYDSAGVFPSSVTYNGVAMTQLGSVGIVNNSILTDAWYIMDPDTGAHNIVVTKPSGIDIAASAISFTGGDTPTDQDSQQADSQGSSSLTLTATKAGLLVDVIVTGTNTPTAGGGQTAFGAVNNFASTVDYSSSYKAVAAGSPSMGWNFTTSDYAHGSVFFPEFATTISQSLSETITLNDSLVKSLSRSFSETITLVDSFLSGFALSKSLSETITWVDSFLSSITITPVTGLILGLVKRTKTIFGTHNEGGPQIGKVARTGTIFGRSKKE